MGYLALQLVGNGGSSLYTIDLATGTASLVGALAGSLALRDLAAPVGTPVPEPATLALMTAGLAGGWARRRRRAAPSRV